MRRAAEGKAPDKGLASEGAGRRQAAHAPGVSVQVIHFYEAGQPEKWLEALARCDWGAGRFLYTLLREGRFRTLCGAAAEVMLLTVGEELVSFCTLAEKDDIRDTELTPWIGFVYTFPSWRGQGCAGSLIGHACSEAARRGADAVYISTNAEGLYERYGGKWIGMMRDMNGEPSRVYRIEC